MNYRDYKINVRFLNDSEIKVKIYNASGPISALLMFLNENQNDQTNMIVDVNIIDIQNNQLMQISDSAFLQ